MFVKYNKDEIKNSLAIDDVLRLVAELGGEPIVINSGSAFTSRTICHNILGEGSHKLYYYDNTKLFKCYTDCASSFDIYELVQKVKNVNKEYKIDYKNGGQGREWQLHDAIEFVAIYFGFSGESEEFENLNSPLEDWKIFDKIQQRQQRIEAPKQIVELKKYDEAILRNLPQLRILPWEREGISEEVIKHREIAYNPRTHGIVIPHRDIDNNLIGIRERTLIKEEEQFGKYKPSILNGVMYNHPLGFNLYNLNNSKNSIKYFKKAIVFEGEKSPLLYASYFGEENDVSVATCGNNLLNYQVQLLLSLGVEEIIVAYDKQFKEEGDVEWVRLKNNLTNIHLKYGSYAQISYLFDRENLLDYKDSPIDKGRDIFLKLFNERVII